MEIYLIQLGNISYQAAIIICIILLVRQAFFWMKVPKKITFCLWFIPFLRMIFPWTIESVWSLLPIQAMNRMFGQLLAYTETDNLDIVQLVGFYAQNPGVAVNQLQTGGASPVIANLNSPEPTTIVWSWITIAGIIWGAGFLILMMYSVISYWKLKCRLIGCICKQGNIYFADHINTPFVLGIWKPRIYIPSDIGNQELEYVIAHEQAHIRRKDYLVKIAAFFIVSLHWFNPLAWVAFHYMGRDMELSCDEAVIRQMGENHRQTYASALLEFTLDKRRISSVPLTFGEKNTKERIKSIMRYKKPLLITVIFAVLTLIVLTVGLLTYPKSDVTLESKDKQSVSGNQQEQELYDAEKREAEMREMQEQLYSDLHDAEKREAEMREMQEQLYSSLYAMGIEEGSLTAVGGRIQIYNNSSEDEITFGDEFHLSRLEQDQWVDVSYIVENVAFNQPAYPIAPGEMRTMDINWEGLYGKLPSGIYLLKKEISIPKKEGGYESIELGVHFTL